MNLVHGPGPWGGPWTPVHVLYTSRVPKGIVRFWYAKQMVNLNGTEIGC